MKSFYMYEDQQRCFIKSLQSCFVGEVCRIENDESGEELLDLLGGIDQIEDNSSDILTIYCVLTMNCNLGCSYCFEKDKPRKDCVLSKEKIVDGISTIISSKNATSINVVFTGGEPLLKYDSLKYIVEGLNTKYGEKCGYGLITNGTVLDEQKIEFFSKNKFSLQISIDGNRPVHDSIRKYVNDNKGSYDLILNNLGKIYKFGYDLGVAIRFNLGNRNYDFDSAFEAISKFKDVNNIETVIYPGFLSVNPNDEMYVDLNQQKAIIRAFLESAAKYNLNTIDRWNNAEMCMFKNKSGITIGADGMLYKCYSIVGDANYVIGKLSDYTDDCMVGSGSLCELSNCFYSNICYGGCPYNTYITNGKMDRDCQYELIDYINKAIFITELGKLVNLSFEEAISSIKKLMVD